MSNPFLRGCVAAVFLLACVAAAPRITSSSLLLNVPTIKGSTSTKGFTGWIDLNAYSFAVKMPAGRGNPVASNLVFTKPIDETSPAFADAYFSNKPFAGSTKLIVLSLQNGKSATATLQVQLHNASVVADSTASGHTGQLETITMSYDAIQYCIPSATGQSMVCQAWNFKTNTPVYPVDGR